MIKISFAFKDEATGVKTSAHRHTNPDRSEGGWVADNVTLPEGVTVEAGAVVWPGAKIAGLKRGDVVRKGQHPGGPAA